MGERGNVVSHKEAKHISVPVTEGVQAVVSRMQASGEYSTFTMPVADVLADAKFEGYIRVLDILHARVAAFLRQHPEFQEVTADTIIDPRGESTTMPAATAPRGLGIIAEMSREEMIDEITELQKDSLGSLNLAQIKRALVQLRVHNYSSRLHDEAKYGDEGNGTSVPFAVDTEW